MLSAANCKEFVGKWGSAPFPKKQVTRRHEMASSCTREGINQVFGKKVMEWTLKHQNRLPREVVETLSLDTFKNIWVWYLRMWWTQS